jgi:hypothetical protein
MEDLDAKEDLFFIKSTPSRFWRPPKELCGTGRSRHAMEPSYQGRSYLGKRRRVEGIVSKFLF